MNFAEAGYQVPGRGCRMPRRRTLTGGRSLIGNRRFLKNGKIITDANEGPRRGIALKNEHNCFKLGWGMGKLREIKSMG